MIDFSIFSKSLKDFAADVHGLRSEIEALERKREDVLYAPANRDDVAAAMQAWVTRSKAAYNARLTMTLKRIAQSAEGTSKPSEIDAIMKSSALTGSGLNPVLPFEADQALAAIFGDQLMESMQATIAATTWPEGEGIPFTQRATEVAKIDAQLEKLRAKHARLIADAAKAGLQVE